MNGPGAASFLVTALVLIGCLSKGDSSVVAGGPIGNTPCERYCNAIRTARCEATDCLADCKAAREAEPGCERFFNAVSDCVSKQTVTCNASGEPVVPSCLEDIQDLKTCEEA